MKEKLMSALKKKFSGLSNELLGLVADKLLPKVTAEDQIQGAISELENSPIPITDFANFLQRESDRRVTEATRTHERTLREKFEFKEKGGTPPATPPAGGDNKELEELKKRLDKFEQKERSQALQDKLINAVKEKKIPVLFARGYNPENEEQINDVVAQIETDYNSVRQELTNDGLQQQQGVPGAGQSSSSIEAGIKEWAGASK